MGYDIEWDGHTVTLPAADDPNGGLSFSLAADWALRLRTYAASVFDSVPGWPIRMSLPVVLLPIGQPNDQVSVAVPRSVANDEQIRHLGFLDKKFIRILERNGGERNGGTGLGRLAYLSSGEIQCTAIIERDNNNAGLDMLDPGQLVGSHSGIKLDLPGAKELARAISDFGRVRTDHVLDRLRTFENAEVEIGALSVAVEEGRWTAPSSLGVASDDVHIGWVGVGYLFLRDERQRDTVLSGLQQLGIPVAAPCKPRPEGAASPEWDRSELPNVFVSWSASGHNFTWVPPDGPSTVPHHRRTFAQYNPTTRTIWVEDQRLVAPACIVAARLGLDIAEIGLPSQHWRLREQVPPAI